VSVENSEQQALSQVADRLQQRFPEVAPDAVRATVEQAYRQLENSRIRDYVPVLVERQARDVLAARG
jgi:hypothetical protein